MTNRLSGELAAEFAGAEKCLLDQDLTTVDGASVWAGDGVHLTSNASRVASRKLRRTWPMGARKAGL